VVYMSGAKFEEHYSMFPEIFSIQHFITQTTHLMASSLSQPA